MNPKIDNYSELLLEEDEPEVYEAREAMVIVGRKKGKVVMVDVQFK